MFPAVLRVVINMLHSDHHKAVPAIQGTGHQGLQDTDTDGYLAETNSDNFKFQVKDLVQIYDFSYEGCGSVLVRMNNAYECCSLRYRKI